MYQIASPVSKQGQGEKAAYPRAGEISPQGVSLYPTMSPTKARGIFTHADASKGGERHTGWCSGPNRHKNFDKRQDVRRNEQVDRILSGA